MVHPSHMSSPQTRNVALIAAASCALLVMSGLVRRKLRRWHGPVALALSEAKEWVVDWPMCAPRLSSTYLCTRLHTSARRHDVWLRYGRQNNHDWASCCDLQAHRALRVHA